MKGLLIFILVITVSCESPKNNSLELSKESSSHNIEKQTGKEKIEPKSPENHNQFTYKLPGSEYFYAVNILKIETEIVQGAFTITEDQYSVKEKADGFLLDVHLEITNPYSKTMMLPIPDYYYITSLNGEWFSSSTTRHRSCQCYIDNSLRVKTEDGKELFSIANGKCGTDDWCVEFAGNEKKVFIIDFKDPFYTQSGKIAFSGFDFLKYGKGKRDEALIIDIETRQVVGKKYF